MVNVLMGVISVGLSMAVTNLYSQIKDFRQQIGDLHLIYAKKSDVQNDFQIIRESLQRIEDKLDRKADR